MSHPASGKKRITGSIIYTLVAMVMILLITNAYLIYRNSLIIEQNVWLQKEAEQIKINTLDIVRTLHQIDMGVRGYALNHSEAQSYVVHEGFERKDKFFTSIEQSLIRQQFPMQDFYMMRDSVNTYFDQVNYMLQLVDEKKDREFLQLLNENNGYLTWVAYRNFSVKVGRFEDTIAAQARARYQQALKNSYWLQIILFLIAGPTLAFTAYSASRFIWLSEKLRWTEEEKNKILEGQNIQLEKMVAERTTEIQAQNEEITAQNEEIALHNEHLHDQKAEIEKQSIALNERNLRLEEAQRIIEEQNQLIKKKNEELTQEVDRQTQNLKRTNTELIEHNNRLEQFTYIISHNLRAPMARLVGLSYILDSSTDPQERLDIEHMMVKSTMDLDHVIKDLSQILGVQKLSTQVYSRIDLENVLDKVKSLLEHELTETKTKLTCHLEVKTLFSLSPYIESIFYNLMSNAIKYRNPEKEPIITIHVFEKESKIHLHVTDHGLGIDLEKNRQHLFNLYKRFHFHVEGKGLGLYLVKTQIESLGGQIEVTSKVNEGTTFKVVLPQENQTSSTT